VKAATETDGGSTESSPGGSSLTLALENGAVSALTPRRSQLRPLTSLRFFAAFGVVMFHFGEPLLGHAPRALQNIVGSGYVGVSFFFVLSGFVLAYAYTKLDSRDATAIRSFFCARVARIYPAYLLSIALCAPFVIGAPTRVAGSALAALLLVQAWFPGSLGVWNFPAWSLSVELFLYLVFPYAIRRIRDTKVRSALFLTFALALLTALLRTITAQQHPTEDGGVALIRKIVAYYPLPFVHVPQFLFGVVLGVRFARERGWTGRHYRAATLSSAAVIVTLMVLAESPHVPRGLLEDGLLAPLFGALIYGLACGGGRLALFLSLPWLVTLGDASYALYILQVPVHDWAIRLHSFNPNRSVHVLAYLAALVAISLAVHRFVERTGRQLILSLSSLLFASGRVTQDAEPRRARE
jgi:peptidoglycan/LPS O-acetylase OafA/YrhL